MRETWNGIPATRLTSEDGATVLIADHGAHVVSWVPARCEEALFMSGRAAYGAGAAIRGGVPIIFPQFAERGGGKRHGFARNATWRHDPARSDDGRAVAAFRLDLGDVGNDAWPHPFELIYEVAVGGRALDLALTVRNLSAAPWECHAALHAYLRVTRIDAIAVTGLQGKRYTEHADQAGALEDGTDLRIAGEIDRLYGNVDCAVALRDEARSVQVDQSGFQDMVIWNPGPAKARLLNDLDPDAYRSFLCIEAAAVEHPVMLGPYGVWQGRQRLACQEAVE